LRETLHVEVAQLAQKELRCFITGNRLQRVIVDVFSLHAASFTTSPQGLRLEIEKVGLSKEELKCLGTLPGPELRL